MLHGNLPSFPDSMLRGNPRPIRISYFLYQGVGSWTYFWKRVDVDIIYAASSVGRFSKFDALKTLNFLVGSKHPFWGEMVWLAHPSQPHHLRLRQLWFLGSSAGWGDDDGCWRIQVSSFQPHNFWVLQIFCSEKPHPILAAIRKKPPKDWTRVDVSLL